MPFADGTFYTLEGEAAKPVLVLSHSLGVDSSMWEPQRAAFLQHFRLLSYETHGHGSSALALERCTIAGLGRDVLALLDSLNLSRVCFCGLSMGGMIGQWLGAHAPERLERLVLSNTAAKIGTIESWNARIKIVQDSGMVAIVPAVIERWFTPSFRASKPEVVSETASRLLMTSPQGYVSCCAAIRDMDQHDTLPLIKAPTLIFAGMHDQVTPPAESRVLAAAIPAAQVIELDAAHLGNLEAPRAFTAAALSFLLSKEVVNNG